MAMHPGTISVIGLADSIKTEADAYLMLERLRWNGTPVCSHCGSDRAYYLNPENGVSRKTRMGTDSQRRIWKCGACRRQFSVLTGTIFHGTKISLRKWLFVIVEMCGSKNGVAAREIERKYNLTPKSAWFMLHRIREAMKREPLAGMLRNTTIVADETYFGGDPRNRHRQGGRERARRGRGTHKTPVFALVDRRTGEVRSKVIPDLTGATLRKAIEEHVDPVGSVLHTDSWAGYRPVGKQFDAHEAVDHRINEFVRGDVSTNALENYFSQLKRSVDGTHHHVSTEHLERYLAEFDYRYSTRKLTDAARTVRLVSQVGGRRLSYRPLKTNRA